MRDKKISPKCFAGWIKFDTALNIGLALADGDKRPAGEFITEWAKQAARAEKAGQELYVIRLPKERAIEIIFEIQKLVDDTRNI